MGRIEKFEDIESWQKARVLANDIFDKTNKGKFAKDFGLRDQIQGASVSIMANIAEGFGSETHKEFLHFLNYSRRSLLEVQSHLYVALDRKYIDKREFDEMHLKSMNIKKLISGFIRYLKKITRHSELRTLDKFIKTIKIY